MATRLNVKDLELYRSLQEKPEEFKDGFNLTTVVGIFFCGLIMMPGGIYLTLMTGGNLGTAASWVTVILFMEIARRALKPMSKQNLSVLLHAAWVMMMFHFLIPGGPLGWLVYRAYLSTSEVARDAGMIGYFPRWIVPPPDSPALAERTFFHRDWILPVAIVGFTMVISFIQKYTLGYLFFRLTSDIEQLPFPLASVNAQGTLALAEADESEAARGDDQFTDKKKSGREDPPEKTGGRRKGNRWRVFSLGAMMGIGFGMLQVGVPAISGLFLSKPFFLIPQPFVDTTTLTEGPLPATPTGVVVDLGIVLLGFVLPFWVVVGTFSAIVLTVIMNPILYHFGILHTWQPGMNTVNTTFANHIDFWLSFGIGSALAISVVCVYAAVRDLYAKWKEIKKRREELGVVEDMWAVPPGRGDYPLWMAIGGYLVSAGALSLVCFLLLPKTIGIVFFLVFYTFLFTPFIAYVNARLLGISGQHVEIPYIKEMGILVSGAKGIDVWLAPFPMDNFGNMAQSFRTQEIIGVRFFSLIKTDLVALPVLFVLSLTFWSFIWKSDAIPSNVFPAAQINWELKAKQDILLYSSTFVTEEQDASEKSILDSEFMKAIHPEVIGGSFAAIMVLYAVLATFGLPVTLIYGLIRGFGHLPHYMILEMLGALIGRFYFQKKFGKQNFMKDAPPLLAGYFTGVGLISMATIAMKLIKSAVSAAPF